MRTLVDKIWDAHLVRPPTPETPAIVYIDLHLVHEVTSPQAFSASPPAAFACGGRIAHWRRWTTRRPLGRFTLSILRA